MVKREIKYRDVKIEVEYEVVKAYRAPRDKYGVPQDEDVKGGVELERVFVADVDITDLLGGQFRAIERVIMEGGE